SEEHTSELQSLTNIVCRLLLEKKIPGKLLSIFEPQTEIIRKGKAGKPNEVGKLVQLQEAENQIITHYEVYDELPSDRDLLLPAVEVHRRILGRTPRLLVAHAGYYSHANEAGAQALGVRYVSVPNRDTRSFFFHQWPNHRFFNRSPTRRSAC